MNLTYLALGDSYTMGEGVMLTETFPYQATELLREKNIQISAAEIIAKTGWTTDELNDAIQQHTFLTGYDFVSLLIGVNNQYRGRVVENFAEEFEILLKKAIGFCKNKPANVFVLSIPDWGKTPFANGKDLKKIEDEINAFNDVCKMVSDKYDCTYIDVTDSQRKNAGNAEYLSADGLHPSAKEYSKWAKILSEKIIELHSAESGQ
ncbi:MAG: GDSL-type esterase/lipase family protein [Ferruginibacter sp.]